MIDTTTVVLEQETTTLVVQDNSTTVIVGADATTVVATGTTGPRGPVGPSGGASSTLEWTQGLAASTWVIPHDLGYKPNVTVFDDTTQIFGEIVHDTIDLLHITFAVVTTGTAVLS